jgi:phage shock protein PspC (stress-responsive transcriptional regulator)
MTAKTEAPRANPFTRDDTFFGVCQAVGEDFGFNPNWLRVAFAVPIMINPVATIGVYAGLGVVVLATRLLVREPRRAKSVETPAATVVMPVPEEMAMAA